MAKYRSLDESYTKWIVKEYTYWALLIADDDQRYLGRAYAWLVREGGMQRFSEITDEELSELRVLMREYEAALERLWQPDFMNYCWLANLIAQHGGHGHMHFIPRYQSSRTFEGVEFVDDRWGKNFTPGTPMELSPEMYEKIRDALKRELA